MLFNYCFCHACGKGYKITEIHVCPNRKISARIATPEEVEEFDRQHDPDLLKFLGEELT